MWDWVKKLQELRGQPLCLVTVIQSKGSTPRDSGAKMIVLPSGEFFGSVGGGQLEELARDEARRMFSDNATQSAQKKLNVPLGPSVGQCCGGAVDLLIEVLDSGPELHLFGAGHVGQAVCRVLEGTPFRVNLIDSREDWINSKEISSSVNRYFSIWEEAVENLNFSHDNTYIAVMTHSHSLDQAIISDLLNRPSKYIGMIGSRTKVSRFKERLLARGMAEETFNRLRSPIGINIGGKAPKEVAISVAAELLKVFYGSKNSEQPSDTPVRGEVKSDGGAQGALGF